MPTLSEKAMKQKESKRKTRIGVLSSSGHLAILASLLLVGCLSKEEYSQEDIQALIDKEVEIKLQNYTRIKNERCQEDLIKEANRLADSVMVAEAFFDRDTAFRPPKPEKPEKPTLKTLKDTVRLKPLFDRSRLREPLRDSSIE